MSNRMLAYVGLSRPYRFERAIIALVALVLVLAVLLTAGWLVAIEELTAFGPRAFYFLYLLALLVLAIALVRWPRLAGALLILALIDFGWGVGSYVLRHSALGAASLLPPDKSEPQRFQWHALAAGRSHPLAAVHQRHRPCDQPHLGRHARAAIRRRASSRRATSWRPSAVRRPTISAPAKATPGAIASPPRSSRAKARVASSSSITACRATRRSNI